MARKSSWMMRRCGAPLALAVGALAAAAAPAAATNEGPVVVAEGLSNPRGMTFGPGGHLYVAESGRGGDGGCLPGPEGQTQCFGATGAIARVDVDTGATKRVVTGLPSIASQEGEGAGAGATGPNDIVFQGPTGFFTVGLAADPRRRGEFGPGGAGLAGLYHLAPNFQVRLKADLGAYEASADPDAGQPSAMIDSNPYSVDVRGPRLLVTDAGGNTLLRVRAGGRVSTEAVFPFGQAPAPEGIPGLPAGTPLPVQPVPTGVAFREDGSVVVGQLTGFPFPVGGASVFAVPRGGTPSVLAGGLTTVVDVARGHGGAVYALQLTTAGLAAPPSPGRLVRIAPDGTQTELAAGQLIQPTGMTVGKDGDVYVATNGFSPSEGRIVRVPAG